MMACGFDKGLIAAHYDGETTPEERLLVERHLATCSECARDLASMKILSSALKPLARASAPMSIAEGVIREIGPSRSAHRPWKAWLVSAAAVVLVAVGTVYMVDRSREAPSKELLVASKEPNHLAKSAAAKAPAHKLEGRREDLSRDKDNLESSEFKAPPQPDKGLADSPKAEVAPPPAALPAPKPAEPAESGRSGAGKALEEDSRQENRWQKVVVPVVRVTTPDPALARAEVDAYLKERERQKVVMGATLLGPTTFVRDRYLQLDLSEEESKELEKRLAALKETLVAPGSFEEEKKRVAEDTAKLKKADDAMAGARLSPDDAKKKEAEKDQAEPDGVTERARLLKDRAVERKKVIFVFELPPVPKK